MSASNGTNLSLRSSVIYSVYLRNYGKGGGFAALEADLNRIQALGADILWLLPIHPIGEENRKGSLGSPYAIRDYRAVNPEYGTLHGFQQLLDAVHARGMRCLIDVVYNHTSPDSVLFRNHPEYFYRGPDGRPGNRAGEWSDVIDLDYSHRDLWEYQIATLQYWAEIGVDGFRCDVASLVPVEFWREARRRVAEVKPGMVWLAESVHPGFLEGVRRMGYKGWCDAELYQAFDITYDYDIHDYYAGHFAGANDLGAYLTAMRRQQSAYPADFLKLRFLENHDQPRAAALLPERRALEMWTAFQHLVRGTALVYMGQEALAPRTPSLFERDEVDWQSLDEEYCALLARLARLRRDPVLCEGAFYVRSDTAHPGVALVGYDATNETALRGIFNLGGHSGEVEAGLPDGSYENLLGGSAVEVRGGKIILGDRPVWLRKPGAQAAA